MTENERRVVETAIAQVIAKCCHEAMNGHYVPLERRKEILDAAMKEIDEADAAAYAWFTCTSTADAGIPQCGWNGEEDDLRNSRTASGKPTCPNCGGDSFSREEMPQ